MAIGKDEDPEPVPEVPEEENKQLGAARERCAAIGHTKVTLVGDGVSADGHMHATYECDSCHSYLFVRIKQISPHIVG